MRLAWLSPRPNCDKYHGVEPFNTANYCRYVSSEAFCVRARYERFHMNTLLLNRRHCLVLGAGAVGPFASKVLALNAQADAAPKSRVALVIGNAAYRSRPLRHAVNDARAMGANLSELGYSVVARENATLAEMIDSMKTFWLQSREADARLIFFAGHGVVHEGHNYLLPVDADINRAEDVSRMAANLDEIIGKLAEATRGVNVVILDACRTPLGTKGARAIPSGLEQVVAPRGTLVAFSTAPGAAALDGNQGNSPYCRHLMAQLKVPGQSIEQTFKRVRQAVARETADQQIPWENSSLTGDFCFRDGATGLCPTRS
jgi:uncharacterized caspase-like protein